MSTQLQKSDVEVLRALGKIVLQKRQNIADVTEIVEELARQDVGSATAERSLNYLAEHHLIKYQQFAGGGGYAQLTTDGMHYSLGQLVEHFSDIENDVSQRIVAESGRTRASVIAREINQPHFLVNQVIEYLHARGQVNARHVMPDEWVVMDVSESLRRRVEEG